MAQSQPQAPGQLWLQYRPPGADIVDNNTWGLPMPSTSHSLQVPFSGVAKIKELVDAGKLNAARNTAKDILSHCANLAEAANETAYKVFHFGQQHKLWEGQTIPQNIQQAIDRGSKSIQEKAQVMAKIHKVRVRTPCRCQFH
jgi:hypothetical protein